MVPQMYGTMKKLLVGESLRLFEHKVQETGNGGTTNYKLVIQGLMTHFFLQK